MIEKNHFLAQNPFGEHLWPRPKNEAFSWVNTRTLPQLCEGFTAAKLDGIRAQITDKNIVISEIQSWPQSLIGADPIAHWAIHQQPSTLEIRVPAGVDTVLNLDLPTGLFALQVIVEKGAKAEFILQGQAYLGLFSWIQEPESSLLVREWSTGTTLAHHHAHLGSNAAFHALRANAHGNFQRSTWRVHLDETGADAKIRLLSLGTAQEESHHHLQIHHHAPQTTSDQIITQVLGGSASASVDGTVIVDRIAQESNSAQIVRSLLLSDLARAHSKPNLQIHADNVKCAHGNTCGELEASELFYLQTRGLSPAEAKDVLTLGFCETVLEDLARDVARNVLHRNISSALAQINQEPL